ncbi:MAG: hypothetical protein C4322_13960 [Mastigocladus sp. ERB_26_1]
MYYSLLVPILLLTGKIALVQESFVQKVIKVTNIVKYTEKIYCSPLSLPRTKHQQMPQNE